MLLVVWGPTTTMLVGLPSFVIAATAAGFLTCSLEPPRRLARTALSCAGVGAASATVILSLIGIAVVSPAAAFLVLVASALTSPAVLGRVRGAAAGRAAGAALEEPALLDQPLLRTLLAPPAEEMTDTQLCRAWRQSFLGLQSARTVAHRTRVVALRCSYLDALEARDPDAFHTWIAAGARAASGPDRYLARHRRGPGTGGEGRQA